MEKPRVPFPTNTGSLKQGNAKVGYPDRAKPCDGHRCVIHDVECLWCGRLPAEQIARSWAERALAVERQARGPAPFNRRVMAVA